MQLITSKQVAKVTALKDLTFRPTKGHASFVRQESTRIKTTYKTIVKIVQQENTMTKQAELRAKAVERGNTTTKQEDLRA